MWEFFAKLHKVAFQGFAELLVGLAASITETRGPLLM